MWNKIYLALLAAAVSAMSFFTFYALSWLGSIGDPRAALDGYRYYFDLGGTVLLIAGGVLLALANVVLWTTRGGWALWATFAFFAVFRLVRDFWLEGARHKFENSGSWHFEPVIGVGVVVAAGAFVFANQYVGLRLQEKMFPPPPEPGVETPVETAAEDEPANAETAAE